MPEDYFKLCSKFIPMLEVLRKSNLTYIYSIIEAMADQNLEFTSLPFPSIQELSQKVDYEKYCNMGLYGRVEFYPDELMQLNLDQLNAFKDNGNDTVMKLFKCNEKQSWAQEVNEDQLYQVFQCFYEDQVFHYENFEFAMLEMRIEELRGS